MLRKISCLSLLLLLPLLPSCLFGAARFEGELDGRAFDPVGTTFAYVDGHDNNLEEVPKKRVAIVLTWVVFDAEGDLNDHEGAELENIKHELHLRDALALVFADKKGMLSGENYRSIREGGVETGSAEFQARIQFAPERLDGTSTYSNFVPYGSKRTVDVRLDQADFSAESPHIGGSIKMIVERGKNDPQEIRSGTLEGSFEAPIVEERRAESNLAILQVEDALGLPLEEIPEDAP